MALKWLMMPPDNTPSRIRTRCLNSKGYIIKVGISDDKDYMAPKVLTHSKQLPRVILMLTFPQTASGRMFVSSLKQHVSVLVKRQEGKF